MCVCVCGKYFSILAQQQCRRKRSKFEWTKSGNGMSDNMWNWLRTFDWRACRLTLLCGRFSSDIWEFSYNLKEKKGDRLTMTAFMCGKTFTHCLWRKCMSVKVCYVRFPFNTLLYCWKEFCFPIHFELVSLIWINYLNIEFEIYTLHS